MELVIRIDEAEYNKICNYDGMNVTRMMSTIQQGIPLPKGHGRLIDADKLDTRERGNNSQRTMWWNIDCIVKDAETIIEADKESNDADSD